METIGQALLNGTQRLKDAGIDSGGLEASLLLARATGLDRLALITRSSTELTAPQREDFEALLARRAGREPFQYIMGTQEFMGLPFEVTPAVLIPRPDTEILVEAILDRFEEARESEGLVADLGTGSGAIALSLAKFLPGLRVVATDLSPEALEVARRNAEVLEVADQVEFREGSGLEPLAEYVGKLTVLASNPPYIARDLSDTLEPEVRDHEPELALYAPEEGLHWYRLLAGEAAALLAPGGHLALEIGHGQKDAVLGLLAENGWQDVRVTDDLGGIPRAVVARRPRAGDLWCSSRPGSVFG